MWESEGKWDDVWTHTVKARRNCAPDLTAYALRFPSVYSFSLFWYLFVSVNYRQWKYVAFLLTTYRIRSNTYSKKNITFGLITYATVHYIPSRRESRVKTRRQQAKPSNSWTILPQLNINSFYGKDRVKSHLRIPYFVPHVHHLVSSHGFFHNHYKATVRTAPAARGSTESPANDSDIHVSICDAAPGWHAVMPTPPAWRTRGKSSQISCSKTIVNI